MHVRHGLCPALAALTSKAGWKIHWQIDLLALVMAASPSTYTPQLFRASVLWLPPLISTLTCQRLLTTFNNAWPKTPLQMVVSRGPRRTHSHGENSIKAYSMRHLTQHSQVCRSCTAPFPVHWGHYIDTNHQFNKPVAVLGP